MASNDRPAGTLSSDRDAGDLLTARKQFTKPQFGRHAAQGSLLGVP